MAKITTKQRKRLPDTAGSPVNHVTYIMEVTVVTGTTEQQRDVPCRAEFRSS